jgi:hypothetical protein
MRNHIRPDICDQELVMIYLFGKQWHFKDESDAPFCQKLPAGLVTLALSLSSLQQ